jgi:hypothetical protein
MTALAQNAPVTLEESMKKLRGSIRALEKICIKKENDLKARQQDLFGGAPSAASASNIVQIDMKKIQEKLDSTIAQVEQMIGEEEA